MLGRKDSQPTARATEREVTMNKDFAENRMAPPVHAAPPAHTPQGSPCVLGPTLHFTGEL